MRRGGLLHILRSAPPWALYEIRGELDGVNLLEADAAIAKLIAQNDGNPQAADA